MFAIFILLNKLIEIFAGQLKKQTNGKIR